MNDKQVVASEDQMLDEYGKVCKMVDNMSLQIMVTPPLLQVLMAHYKDKDSEKYFKIKFLFERIVKDFTIALEICTRTLND
jgi:hypothetical protein